MTSQPNALHVSQLSVRSLNYSVKFQDVHSVNLSFWRSQEELDTSANHISYLPQSD